MSIKSIQETIRSQSSNEDMTQTPKDPTGILKENIATFSSDPVQKLDHLSNLTGEGTPITLALASIQPGQIKEITFPNGDRYVGEWNHDLPNGKGKIIFLDGESYDGQWLDGEKHGHGVYIRKDGKYEGEWDNGVLHGKCEITFRHAKYKGGYVKGFAHGKGELSIVAENAIKVIKGDFVRGRAHGKAEIVLIREGNKDRYVGEVKHGKKHGKGEFFTWNGDKYVGDFFENQMHGSGVMIYADGRRYEGSYVHDKRSGKGVLMYAEGDKYVGDFVDSFFQGKGEYLHSNGSKHEGFFVSDHLDGHVIFTDNNGIIYEEIYANGSLKSRKRITAEQKRVYQKIALRKQESAEINKEVVNPPKNNVNKKESISEFLKQVELADGTDKNKGKKKEAKLPIESSSSKIANASNSNARNQQQNKEKLVSPNKQKMVPVEKDSEVEDNQSLDIKKQILELLKDGSRHLLNPQARVLRWRKNDVLSKMEDFKDGEEYKYRGLSLEEKRKIILFHEGGSMLDPIIFHPDMKEEYVYNTDKGIGCYVEIITSEGRSYRGVLEFGIDGNSCYHRMFEVRNNIDFLTLTMDKFFNSQLENETSFIDPFYEEEKENQIMYANYVYELDAKTGVYSVQDHRKNINATFKIFPLSSIKGKLARASFENNFYYD